MTVTVLLRGMLVEVEVDKYVEDEETNACECEWRFDNMTPEEHADLHITAEEEKAIVQKIGEAWREHRG